MKRTLCRVAFNREVRVRMYRCDSMTRSTLIYKKRERIKRLEKKLFQLEARRDKKKQKRKSFFCVSIS